ncbi:class D beta-lactamase [Tabrizicola sp. J26]|uniref:class D beta-lactamase n=1 Tax=Alitabrizicola rongguiensis TaxID=2909234 RepID=UPI001EFF396B|nr:class D beta-lactamase [Tabrizicola rongguiensis]MCF1710188.1 class D beta-lactamase [Tabrizicola rongguiensis]
MRSTLALSLSLILPLVAVPAEAGAPLLQCTVVADVESGDVLHREGDCATRMPPMSSFKLPLAIMGFDAGVLIDAHTPVWDLPAGEEPASHAPEIRRADAALWEEQSLVWFSRVLTGKLGMERFAAYTSDFAYGNADVSGDPGKNNGLTQSWLMSSLAISPDEQVDFLRRFRLGDLPVSKRAVAMTEAVLPVFQAGGWTVHGKTGTGYPLVEGKPNRATPLGWFVGWAEKEGREVVFATMQIDAERGGPALGPHLRGEVLEMLPAILSD